MRVLLDENLPHDLARELPGHDVLTVQGLGWFGIANGTLLQRASGRFDALVTMDRNLEHQHALGELPFGTVVLLAPSNRMAHLRPLIADLLRVLAELQAGAVRHVGAARAG